MIIYKMSDPYDKQFAKAARLGKWSDGGICKECGLSTHKRIKPIVIEWDPGSDIVSDFTWTGFQQNIVVTQRVKEVFDSHLSGVEYGPVEMVQKTKLSNKAKKMKQISLPYLGITLWELWVVGKASFDLDASNIKIINDCHVCGQKKYEYPKNKSNLVINPETWSGDDIFIVEGWNVCTEKVKDVCIGEKLTNITFEEIASMGRRTGRSSLVN